MNAASLTFHMVLPKRRHTAGFGCHQVNIIKEITRIFAITKRQHLAINTFETMNTNATAFSKGKRDTIFGEIRYCVNSFRAANCQLVTVVNKTWKYRSTCKTIFRQISLDNLPKTNPADRRTSEYTTHKKIITF